MTTVIINTRTAEAKKMVELLNGKMKFAEAKDLPLPVIR